MCSLIRNTFNFLVKMQLFLLIMRDLLKYLLDKGSVFQLLINETDG